jgi:hypothetical protein
MFKTLAILVIFADLLCQSQSAKIQSNIVFILVDDMDLTLFNDMPKLSKYMTKKGTTFTNYINNVPICGPSRSSIITGVFENDSLNYAKKQA